MILCIGTTPAVQRVMVFRKLEVGEVNRAHLTFDGGAGKSINVAKVLVTLGESAFATGFLGGDRGHWLGALLTRKGVRHDFVEVQTRTRECVTVIDEALQQQTELVEESSPIKAGELEKLWRLIRDKMRSSRAVVLSGTLAPGVPDDFYRTCVQEGCQSGALCLVDAKGAPLQKALEAAPALVKPNRHELAATVGRPLQDERATMQAMREVFELGARRVVVTAGKFPTLAFDGGRFWKIASPAIKPLNPIGSGDSFTAGLVWRLAAGDDLGEACRWGSAAGAANALSWMPGDLERSDVLRLYEHTRAEPLS